MSLKLFYAILAVSLVALAVWLVTLGGHAAQAVRGPMEVPSNTSVAPAHRDVEPVLKAPPPPAAAEREAQPAYGPISVAAPTLTFEGHLVDFISQQFPDTLPQPARLGQIKTVDDVVRDKIVNPDGKVLSNAARTQLANILGDLSKRELVLDNKERPLNRVALTEAVRRGQFAAIENKNKASMATAEGIAAMQQERKRQQEELAKTQHLLQEKYGTPLKDWGYTILSSIGPGGNGYVTTVYFTRAQAADLFACRDEMAGLLRERQSALTEFFLNQPK